MAEAPQQGRGLSRLPVGEAGRPARRRGDDAVLHRAVRQSRRTPRSGRRRDGDARGRAREGRGLHRGAARGDRLHLRALPSRATSHFSATRTATGARATTSSSPRSTTSRSTTSARCSRRRDSGSARCRPTSSGASIRRSCASASPPRRSWSRSGWASNEIGTVQPMAEIAEVVAGTGAVLHSDAVAAQGQLPIDVSQSASGC